MKWLSRRGRTEDTAATTPAARTPPLIEIPFDSESFRWFHDKYEHALQHEEDVLSSHLSFFYVLQGLIVSLLVGVFLVVHTFALATFLVGIVAILGLASASVSWAVVARTGIACSFWRHSLWALESLASWTGVKLDTDRKTLTTPYVTFESVFRERKYWTEETLLVPTLTGRTICKWVGVAWVVVFIACQIVFWLGPVALSWAA